MTTTDKQKLNDIHEWVIGNPLKEIQGAVVKLSDHEKRIERLEKKGFVNGIKKLFFIIFK